jgi:Carboxypeptidase regulatory-like domain
MKITSLIVGLFAVTSVAMITVSARSYETAPVANGGTIAGKVVFRGDVPTRKIIPTKDQEVCGGIREDPLVEVGPDQGVQNVVVYLDKIAKGKAWPPPGKTPELNNLKCRFEPHVQVVPAGALDVVNGDPILHNTHGFYGKRTAFNMALPNQDQRIGAELPRPGTVRVECDAHGWMLGWIYVADNPYYAVTGADGKFTIGDVAPGSYTLVMVQEYTGTTEMPVTVAAGKPTELTIELKKQ